MNTEITIIKNVKELVSNIVIHQSDVDKLLDDLDSLLFSKKEDDKKFGVLLNTKVVATILSEVSNLENQISTLGNSRSNQERRQNLIAKNNCLSSLITNLFTIYSDYLKKNEVYKVFEKSHIQRIEEACQNLLNERVNDEYPFPEYYDKKNADNIITEIEEYYNMTFLNPENTLFVKTKLTQLSVSLKSKISDVDNEIIIWDSREKEYRKELLLFSKNKSEEKDRVFDLYHCEMSGIINLQDYKRDLVRLYNHILEEYPFINSKPITISDVTVFGDSNIETIKRIYLEFSDFIDETVTNESDFVQTFLDLPINHKINLIKGTLSDYAYFIRGLKPFFILKYKQSSGTYNQWWSDRFLFSGKEKSRKEISNMISGLDSGRPATKRVVTNNIVNFLRLSYNRPTEI